MNHTEKLAALCHHQGSGSEHVVLEEAHFTCIAEEMSAMNMKVPWIRRPRLYYLLSNIGKIAVMDIFIAHGHNDTHIPYSKRTLPHIKSQLFSQDELEQFLKLQKSCESKVLQLEKGVWFSLPDGDVLFERRRRTLGNGSQGLTKVDAVISLKTGIKYARKRINRKVYGKEAGRAFERELQSLVKIKTANHEHLIQFRGAYTDRKYFVLLLQPVADCNLRHYLSSEYQGTDAQKIVLSTCFGCMANAMFFLHETVQILHKDVKAENFLLKDGRIILTDFGTSFDWSATNQSSTGSNRGDPYTKRYASPEVVNESEFHRASDIWSLGVVFLEIWTVLRARTLQEFDFFMSQHHSKAPQIYANPAGAQAWMEELKDRGGNTLEDEPVTWIQSMLSPEMRDRPTASLVYESALYSRYSMYCGRCCLDDTSDASSVSDRTDNGEGSSLFQPVRLETSTGPRHRQGRPSKSHPIVDAKFYSEPVFAKGQGTTSMTTFGNSLRSGIGLPQQVSRHDDHIVQAPRTSAAAGKREEPLKTRIKEAATQPIDQVSHMKQIALLKHRAQTEQRSKFQQVETALPDVQSQRMAHFLRGLPRRFDNVPGFDTDDRSDPPRPSKSKELRLPVDTGTPSLDHLLISPRIPEDPKTFSQKKDRFEGRMIRYSSDGHIRESYETSASSRAKRLMDLRKFSESLCIPKAGDEDAGSNHSAVDHTNSKADNESPEPQNHQNRWSGWYEDSDQCSRHNPRLATWSTHPLVTWRQKNSSTVKEEEGPRVEKLDLFLSNIINEGSSLEPASTIIERVLEEKESLAKVSSMSFSTAKLLRGNRAVMKWNDEMYGYLPSFTGQGKVAAVKRLLADGCNPGLPSSPRWLPVLRAVKGRTENHNKCLIALLRAGADVNARESGTGKTYLHHALSQEPWSGYSTTVYLLLTAGIDPNVAAPNLKSPVLSLLEGEAPLGAEQRDALLMLLSPRFGVQKHLLKPETNESTVHLAIRHKNPTILEAILSPSHHAGEVGTGATPDSDSQKLQTLQHKSNEGLTPLLLLFTICTFHPGRDEENAERLVEILLGNGANPDDQDLANEDTALHMVISKHKNIKAFEALVQHGANPHLENKQEVSPCKLLLELARIAPSNEFCQAAQERVKALEAWQPIAQVKEVSVQEHGSGSTQS